MAAAAHTFRLPLADWPPDDLRVWESLFEKGDIFADAGTARHWVAATRRTNRDHYAAWLGWLQRTGSLERERVPWARATPEAVRAYAEHLIAGVAPKTTASMLIGLKVVLKAMHPGGPWRWLMDLTNRVNAWAEPVVDREAQLRPVEAIHARCCHELDRLRTTPLLRRIDRVAYRDALIVLILSSAPVRLRNLASIEIGSHLTSDQDRFQLRFVEEETKNRQRLSFVLPRDVGPYLELYLDQIRPSFGPAADDRHFWLGFEGEPLTAHSIYGRIQLVTKRLFGAPINPHSFRACAATSFALRSPEMARLAAPLLGHRYFSTTERHYVKAKQIEASRRVNAALAAIPRPPERTS